jgi:glycosyltransferase involved in cell wall biosynthesis
MPMKIVYVLSYKYPDYVRTRYLLQMLSKLPDVRVFRAINTNKGVFRYFQSIASLIYIRIRHRPDVYMLGFRGAEIYWLVRLITAGKPLVYDEFLNPYLWFVDEHKKSKENSMLTRLIRWYVRFTLRSANHVLSDTNLHADYSAKLSDTARDKFTALYVGTDENVFKISKKPKHRKSTETFEVFFYGTFLPLHGIDVILDAANLLSHEKHIKFTIVGGASREKDMEAFLDKLNDKNVSNVRHLSWVDFEKLPKYIEESDVCLGGPFANSPQAQKVITGKTYQFLAMGKATIVGKIAEDVGFVDKKNCLFVDQGSAKSIADAVGWAYGHRGELNVIGTNGDSLYDKVFSQQAQLKKIQKVLKDLTS